MLHLIDTKVQKILLQITVLKYQYLNYLFFTKFKSLRGIVSQRFCDQLPYEKCCIGV